MNAISGSTARAPLPGRAHVSEMNAHAPTTANNPMNAWPQYAVDALQRGVLFLDLMRRRGAEEIEITRGRWRPCCASSTIC